MFGEVGVDGADVDVGAGRGDPVLHAVDLQFECPFEVAEGHFGFVGPG